VWGENSYDQLLLPVGLTGITAIAAGEAHTLALGSNGKVFAWGGDDTYGPSTVPAAALSGVTAIAAGFGHSLALKGDGTVVAWGLNASGQRTVPAGLTGVIAIAAGSFHSMALKNDGTVVAWGQNYYGQTTVPTGLGKVVAIAAGWHNSTALLSNGTLVSWGEGLSDQEAVPGGLSGVTAIAAGGYHKVALKADGTVFGWGYNNYGQTIPPGGLSGVTAIASGAYHTVALKDDGTAVAWGRNQYGQAQVPAGSSVTTFPGTVIYTAGTSTATFTPTAPLPAPAVLTATITSGVKNLAGISPASDYSWNFITSLTGVNPARYILSVGLLGTGSGSVHSVDNLGNISCGPGSSNTCSAEFYDSIVQLAVTPDWKSLFDFWGGDCNGTGTCRPYMDKVRSVTASFKPNKQAIVNNDPNSGFATLQEAYNGTDSGKSIQTHVYTFYEDVTFGDDKVVTLDGGKEITDSTYKNTVGFTTVEGSLTIKAGKTVIKNFIIKSKAQ
jgi:hypothetical protein